MMRPFVRLAGFLLVASGRYCCIIVNLTIDFFPPTLKDFTGYLSGTNLDGALR